MTGWWTGIILVAQQATEPSLVQIDRSFVALLGGLIAACAGAWLLGTARRTGGQAWGAILSMAGLSAVLVAGWRMTPTQLMAAAMVMMFCGLYLILSTGYRGRVVGMLMAAASVMILASQISGPWRSQLQDVHDIAFWVVGAVLVIASLATVSSHSAIYSAIWFALALLSTGALMLVQGAQFLGIATVAVYAGAIVVTFLFVLMLAQPEGLAFYDRISWGHLSMLLAAGAAAVLTGLVVQGIGEGASRISGEQVVAPEIEDRVTKMLVELQPDSVQPDDAQRWKLRSVRWVPQSSPPALRVTVGHNQPGGLTVDQRRQWSERLQSELGQLPVPAVVGSGNWQVQLSDNDVFAKDHVALLGRNLFGRHLLAVELAGVLLFIALVGAVAMAAIRPSPISGYAGRAGNG
ncbi:MAG: NADH-quinone oxidoreductase subunit J [Pirellulales bacterium]